ncbi:MAG: acyl-CoA dehydrogenase [Marine Group III euryarchaeote CG-Epi1]|jgi:alkylation response protein AidB-like acyl-CoA dehydrogenase|uniref:Acyl-CoA dehydrogenase n=1 Tax=Marine Group III euryarchaeote CG-Epi1 TaxID=1888995 RepID=A0A1J5TI39_9ARCH|nr:MAG: acyl-CoA dehydrogenase [Marine Group III euryarchaeote CG-Epi1]|tara:strand:+ start:113 stop:1921 length:1809 start_codon:yes stop_codon:yes gene_type:complete
MVEYKAPKREYEFILREVLDIEKELAGYENYEEATWDMIEMIADQYDEIAREYWLSSNAEGDTVGATFDSGKVTISPGMKEAAKVVIESGLSSLFGHKKYGGMEFPNVINTYTDELCCSTNMSLGTLMGLTKGGYHCLHNYGSEELKDIYLPKFLNGEYFATMCLTEAHCGTDLGLIRTKAVPENEAFRVSGQKIFITAGEHDLSDNIIHLVLAKLPDAPPGAKGISLFLVPKILVNDDGSLGDRNGVNCVSIEEKMGVHGSPTCVLSFEDSLGYLVGEPHKGLEAMFSMMNNERIAVGMQGLGVAEISYQNALLYAKDRLQGRDLKGAKKPSEEADPLLVHPDIRRMLLRAKALIDSSRMLSAWTALAIDRSVKDPDENIRRANNDLVELMTPIIKSILTDYGVEISSEMLQIFGGHGYIREYGMEQFYRDARIAPIWEGTNGIQAMDLAGRKMPQGMGRLLRRFFHPALAFIEVNRGDENLKEFVIPFEKALKGLQKTSMFMAQKGLSNPYEIGAAASDYMKQFGLVSMGYMWLLMLKTAFLKQDEDDFYKNKIIIGRFFFERILPETLSRAIAIGTGSKTMMSLPDDGFESANKFSGKA